MRLSEEERATLVRVAETLTDRNKIEAICAYGSKVAGYSRPDSDYDLIVVVRNFREGVRYRYLETPVNASALLVDGKLLDQDARASSLGEFVVGRLLNVYEPITNAELFTAVEHEYKKRVIAESLIELSSDYGDFCRHITIPFDYFLFDKLRKRAVVYPPALYSYVMTYGCPSGHLNREASVEGFRSAARDLLPRGFFRIVDGGVKIVPERMRGDAFTKVQSLFALTARGVTQYAVHGYAGRVGLSVFRKEAQSKLKRMRERPDPPPELERPRVLLKLTEGAVVADPSRLEQELATILGFSNFKAEEKLIGDPYSTTRILTISEGKGQESIVLKNFSDVRSLKWALLGIWASAAKFSMTPLARLEREYAVTLALRENGIKVPRVIAVSPDVRVLVKEFVEGPTLSMVIDDFFKGDSGGLRSVGSYGSLMAQVHRTGYALGDAKASNVIVSPKGLFLTDLEQAHQGGDESWDLAEFVYYTAKLSTREREMDMVAKAFLDAYASVGERDAISRAGTPKYLRPFQPFILPGMARSLRDLMSSYA